jgi:hypothetical protein
VEELALEDLALEDLALEDLALEDLGSQLRAGFSSFSIFMTAPFKSE